MKRCLLTLLGFLFLGVTMGSARQSSSNRPDIDIRYYYTGNDYIRWSYVQQVGYISGFVDTFMMAEATGGVPALAGPGGKPWLEPCVRNRRIPINQFTDVVTKAIRDHPERRDGPLAPLAFNAINEMCPKSLK